MTSRRLVAMAALVVVASAGLVALDQREAYAQTVYTSLVSLRVQHGEDPRATDSRLRIPSIGLDAAVGAHRVAAKDARMPNPYGPGDVAWYDFESTYVGGAPGSGGNAIYSGHVDYAARLSYVPGARYSGAGVFARLDELKVGDLVEVQRGGKTYRYAVSWSRVLPDGQSAAWAEAVSSKVPVESLTLYTCDGTFNAGTISYSHRLVVRAELVEGMPNRLPAPTGRFSIGTSGTTHPAALASAQRWPVEAIYSQDPGSKQWLTYRPGAPAFANTLFGKLRQDSFVIAQFK